MAKVRLDQVNFCSIQAHGQCFRAVFTGTFVHPEWHLRWDGTGGGVWHIDTPSNHVCDVVVRKKWAAWPPIALLEVDESDLGVDLRPVVAYIRDHLWPRDEPSPFA